jgi:HAD superfamily hydrolase (TIGR01484 family)
MVAYKIIIADMDGTLTYSNQKASKEMLEVVDKVANKFIFAIISGATYAKMKEQICGDLKNFHYVISQSGAECHTLGKLPRRENKLIYRIKMDKYQKAIIRELIKSVGLNPKFICDKGGQITYYLLGTKAKYEDKIQADPKLKIRKKLIKQIKKNPEADLFDITIGGTTAIDFLPKGINKRHGVDFLRESFDYTIDEVLFIGDRCFPGGNDWLGSDYNYKQVKNPNETLEYLKKLGDEDVLR